MVSSSDHSFIIVGSTRSFTNGESDLYLVKVDSSGNLIWHRSFGGPNADAGFSLTCSGDSVYFVVGYCGSSHQNNDVWLLKVDAEGESLCSWFYGGDEDDEGMDIIPAKEGGYLILASTYSFGSGSRDIYLIRIDSNGDTLWTKTYGGSSYDVAYEIQPTYDNGYVIVGCTYSEGNGLSDVYLIRLNVDGDTLWTRTYGGEEFECGYSIKECPDSGFILVGFKRSIQQPVNYYSIYIVRTDRWGDTLWTVTHGGEWDAYARWVQVVNDEEAVIVGARTVMQTLDWNIYLLKIDRTGKIIWKKILGGYENDEGYQLRVIPDGGYIIVGRTSSFGAGKFDVYLIRMKSEIGIEDEERQRPLQFLIYPNPAHRLINLDLPSNVQSLTLFDASGRLIHQLSPSPHLRLILPPGIYFLKIKTPFEIKTEKLVVVR